MNRQIDICERDRLVGLLRQEAESVCGGRVDGEDCLCRFEVECDGLVPLAWLGMQKEGVKVYWSDRDEDFAVAGAGAVEIVSDRGGAGLAESLGDIEREVARARGAVRYYGGMSFDAEDGDEVAWGGFGRFCFVVAKVEVCRSEGRSTTAFNVRRRADDTAGSIVDRLIAGLDEYFFHGGVSGDVSCGDGGLPAIVRRTDIPDRDQWNRMVEAAMRDMSSRGIRKVVLSRKTVIEMSEGVNGVALLARVGRQNRNTYDFYFQFDGHDSFIGCSPECLFYRNDRSIYSEAVAGTCPAGKSDEEKLHHQGRLRRSEKEQEEHGYVHDNVKSELDRICGSAEVVDEKDIISLSNVQHLRSTFRGELRDGVSTYDIISTLHPTAAVNGFPKEEAMELIRRHERFSRGWYAGPVGWIGRGESRFAVAIRSARMQDNEISLFAGAGLVDASEAHKEWDETEQKLSIFLDVLGEGAQDISELTGTERSGK
jgi:menaquinone-specific isochorismate synthase